MRQHDVIDESILRLPHRFVELKCSSWGDGMSPVDVCLVFPIILCNLSENSRYMLFQGFLLYVYACLNSQGCFNSHLECTHTSDEFFSLTHFWTPCFNSMFWLAPTHHTHIHDLFWRHWNSEILSKISSIGMTECAVVYWTALMNFSCFLILLQHSHPLIYAVVMATRKYL